MSFSTTQLGPFAPPITQSLKPLQVRQYLGATYSLTLFIADWNKIGDYRQCQTDLNTARMNSKQIDYDYKVGDKVLLTEEGILCKAESPYNKEPWTITTLHTNGTIRIQCGTKSERLNIRRVTPFVDE
jgi:hypothetical protein